MLVAIMATLKAGAAYVPLDGGIVTDSALSHVTANSGSHIIAVGKEWAHRVDVINGQLAAQGNPMVYKFVLEDIIVEASQDLDENRVYEEVRMNEFGNSGKGDNGCYVIYTSG
jgi:acyl-CoA synthetase (AMP-forming)/AMP-acid ligase II